MGAAWGYRAFDNDSALDWLGAFIEQPIALVIEGTLKDFLRHKRVPLKFGRPKRTGKKIGVVATGKVEKRIGRRGGHDDVVAAAALLDALTPYDPQRDVKICLRSEAEHERLYSLAIEALREASKDPWIEEWELANEKRNQLANLIVSLKRKARNERGRNRSFGKRRK
jgi:uncharacterized protein DUF4259